METNNFTDNNRAVEYKSPYRRGADNGIVMGLWLSLMFTLWSYTIYDTAPTEVLSLSAFGTMLCVPVILFFMLRRTWKAEGRTSSLSSLWVEGIMTFIFGAIIAVIVGYLFMRVAEPTYLNDLYKKLLSSLLDASNQIGGAAGEQYAQIASNFRDMMERGELPGVIELLLNTMWFVTFAGCVLSLIVAALVRAIKR